MPRCIVIGTQSAIGNLPIGRENNRTKEEGGSLADVIEIRLPPAWDYLPVLRATVGMLAGTMLFNYDEIIQLRVAVSEAFNLAIRQAEQDGAPSTPVELSMRFVVVADRIEILMPNRPGFFGQIDAEHEVESRAILESLMDEVAFAGGAANEPLISMTKYNTAGAV